MQRFSVVANTVGARLAVLADWLYGCAHSTTTFPITLRPGEGPPSETYVVCLDCGRHLAYDWSAMRITGGRFAPPARLIRGADSQSVAPALMPALGGHWKRGSR